MTSHMAEPRRSTGATILVAVGAGIPAAALCFLVLHLSPLLATPLFAVIAILAGTISLTRHRLRSSLRAALAGVAVGLAIILFLYWLSLLIHLEP